MKSTSAPQAAAHAADIALVGIGCRFPAAADGPQALWAALMAGLDGVGEVGPERWSVEQHYHPRRGVPGKTATRWAGLVEGIDRFDCEFFGISPREAATMDPQQRLLLQVCWEALEDAGQRPAAWRQRPVGVFVGGFTLDYMLLQLGGLDLCGVEPHTATGSMMTLLANRLSYVFGFTGPSMAIDTACSSSLVAVHLACRSLASGECEMAVAGGVNALLTPSYTVAESRAGMLSPSGRSRAFDAAADGYTRGEGAGLVVLKTLARAQADGDLIYAVIRATAVNQDGHNEGLTVPSGEAQMALMRGALAAAGVAPGEVIYAEAHGTGTPVGDPIEARAIGTVLREGRNGRPDCLLGSIKTNIGHTEAAAGVAGLIKTAQVLHHRQVPPHLHLRRVNPAIPMAKLRLELPLVARALPEQGLLHACVNSFGFGGTNAHAVLDTAPAPGLPPAALPTPARAAPVWVLPLSSRHGSTLAAMAAGFAAQLLADGDDEDGGTRRLADICHSAARHRDHLAVRACAIGRSRAELVNALQALAASPADGDGAHSGLVQGQAALESSDESPRAHPHQGGPGHTPDGRSAGAPRLVFTYTGMGPQWSAMGHQACAEDPVFAAALDEVLDVFQRQGVPLRQAWFAAEADSRMAETEVAQPANFALQVALTTWLAQHGVTPDAVVGHSAGEPAAAWAAGALSLDDAVRVVWARSRWQQTTTGQGRMLAVGLGEAAALAEIAAVGDASLSLAAINSPAAVTIVGSPEGTAALQARLETAGHFVRMLQVRVPYHSAYMDPLREPLLADLVGLQPQAARVPLWSTVSGEQLDGRELDAAYWWQNVRQPVRFEAVTRALRQALPEADWIEVGPHPVLAQSLRETAAAEPAAAPPRCWPTLRRAEDETLALRRLLATLHTHGHGIDWEAVNGRGAFVRLPRRAWRDTRHWNELPQTQAQRTGVPEHPLLARRLDTPQPTWEADLLAPRLAYLEDHCLQGATVFPGAGYVSMALHAARSLYGALDAVAFADIRFERALYLNADETRTLRLSIDPDSQRFNIASRPLADAHARWERHCSGRLRLSQNLDRGATDLAALQARCNRAVTADACYRHFRGLGLEYGPSFQGIQALWQGPNEALARLVVPEGVAGQLADYDVHPAVLDVCFQTLAAALPMDGGDSLVYMPTGVKEGRKYRDLQRTMWVHARISEPDRDGLAGDIRLYDDAGQPVVEIDACTARALGGQAQAAVAQRLYEPRWLPQPLPDGPPTAEPGLWLIYGGAPALADAVALALREQDQQTLQLQANVLDGLSRGTWLSRLAHAGGALRGVIHLDASAPGNDPGTDIERGCLVTLALVQALAEHGAAQPVATPPRLWLVTRATQAVAGHAVEHPMAAAMWGLGRVIGHAEHVGLWGGLIDLPAQPPGGLLPGLGVEASPWPAEGRQIAAECLAGDSGHDETAWREGRRYVAQLAECNAQATLPHAPALRQDASYLITGGLGALGLASAAWLVQRGARHLLLVGREALPPRQTWADPHLPAALAEKVAAVRALEAEGAHVRIDVADVGDAASLAALLHRHAEGCWPPLRGVIHSAGVARPRLLAEMDAAEFCSVLPAKVLGAWNLHHALRDTPLDFFVLYSSVASQVVSMGQGNYAAANACLDALAHWRRAQGLPALSIGWGPWGDVGMATQLDLVKFFHDRGLYPMTSSQGTAALGALMAGRVAHAVVLGARWQTVAETSPLSRAAPLIRALVAEEARADGQTTGSGGTVRALRALLAEEPEAEKRRELLVDGLRRLVCRVMRLGDSELGPDDAFNSRGMDSMMAIEVKNRIEHELAVRVASVDLLKGASARALAGLVCAELDARANAPEAPVDELAAALQALSAEQIEALLGQARGSDAQVARAAAQAAP